MQALRSYRLLVTWQALRKKAYLPLMMAVQTLFSLASCSVTLFCSYAGQDDDLSDRHGRACHLDALGRTRRPAANRREAKSEGSLAYMRSLPVPRLAYLVADLTVWLAIVVPGVVLGVLVGAWRFGLDLQVSPSLFRRF